MKPQSASLNMWSLSPVSSQQSKTYFEAKIHSVNVKTTSTTINFKIEILINSKNNLPTNIYLAGVEIPEFRQQDLLLKPAGFTHNEEGWLPYELDFVVAKKDVSYGNGDLQSKSIPLRINFYANPRLLESIQNQLEPNALKFWLDNMFNTILSSQIRLDAYFQISTNQGTTQLYDILPTDTNAGHLFDLTWNMNYYLRMQRLDQINELIQLRSTVPLQITDLTINFYYFIEGSTGYKTLTLADNTWKNINANDTLSVKLPTKVLYDTNTKTLFKEDINGHNIFLPNGGQGYYDIGFKIQIGSTFYNINASNKFNYINAFDNPTRLDFFSFDYNPINSLNGFLKA
ncbi:DUF5443 family protein [[Mycoplasma] testudinis]|uniref:DUF5443 family protein n=1 Tax=[Mycoplasma] testudinis TaxID=33924 RepID=UPI0012EC0300|nr:DUF5443 family protein [[Mycoplasma] testudinis]